MIILSIVVVAAIVMMIGGEYWNHRKELQAVDEYTRQLSIKRGDEVLLPDGQRGVVYESTTDTLLVETESGEHYSVIRWACKALMIIMLLGACTTARPIAGSELRFEKTLRK